MEHRPAAISEGLSADHIQDLLTPTVGPGVVRLRGEESREETTPLQQDAPPGKMGTGREYSAEEGSLDNKLKDCGAEPSMD